MKGSRVKQLEPFIDGDSFFLTYGDGVCNVNIDQLLSFHESHGKIGTLTAVHPPSRFGEIDLDGSLVTNFDESSKWKQDISMEVFLYLTEHYLII